MVQINAYGDVVVILYRNLKAMEKALQELVNTVQEMRMLISRKQTV